MTLIPIEHPRRLGSPAEAERLFRALRERRVSARGFHTSDPNRIGRLVAAIDPRREHTISFVQGRIAAAELEALVGAPYGYLDLRTQTASLRIWPELYAWVHVSARRLAEVEGMPSPATPGEFTVGDHSVTIPEEPERFDARVETRSPAAAWSLFRGLTDPHIVRGFINRVADETRAPLVNFLRASGLRVDAVLEVPLATATALTELYPGEHLDWQANMLLVEFPEGRVHGFLTTPKTGDRDRDRWLARVTRALARAELS